MHSVQDQGLHEEIRPACPNDCCASPERTDGRCLQRNRACRGAFKRKLLARSQDQILQQLPLGGTSLAHAVA